MTDPSDGTTDCAPEGDTAVGGECVNTNNCVAGATCIGFQGQEGSTCVPHCDSTADPDACAEGTHCQATPTEPLGLCVPNQ